MKNCLLCQPFSQGVPQNSAVAGPAGGVQVLPPIQPGVSGVPGAGAVVAAAPVPSSPVVSAAPVGGVSFAPGGKSGTGGAGYVTSAYGGSMESLNSTNSSTLSYASTLSTGGPSRKKIPRTQGSLENEWAFTPDPRKGAPFPPSLETLLLGCVPWGSVCWA